jgi:hypothetical protein
MPSSPEPRPPPPSLPYAQRGSSVAPCEVIAQPQAAGGCWVLPPPALAGHYVVVAAFLLLTSGLTVAVVSQIGTALAWVVGAALLIVVAAVGIWSLRLGLLTARPREVDATPQNLRLSIPTTEGMDILHLDRSEIAQVWVRYRAGRGWALIILCSRGAFRVPFCSTWTPALVEMEQRLRELLGLPATSQGPPRLRRYITLGE